MSEPTDFLPLSEAVFRILLSLSAEPLHGYGILQEVEARGGEMGTGTLYTALKRLRDDGLVEETDPPEDSDDPRRRYHVLTPMGRRVLVEEGHRLQGLLDEARRREVLEGRSG